MSVYDTTLILNPQLEESGIDGRIKETVELIHRFGGKVQSENRMGMRRLAYEIQKVTQGYYVTLVFEGDQKVVTEMERAFRLDEGCLRYLTCLYQDFSRRRPKSDRSRRESSDDRPAAVESSNGEPKVNTAPKPRALPADDDSDDADSSEML